MTSAVAEVTEAEEPRQATQLPEPQGYRMLIGLPEIEEKTEGGIIKPQQTVQDEQTASVVGFVLKQGKDCYHDKGRYPGGPWCKEGDFILIGAFQGKRFELHGQEFRIINEDQVLATIEDPRGFRRI